MSIDKTISELTSVTSFSSSDLFVLVHTHTSKVTWLVMRGLIHDYLATQDASFAISQSISATTNQLVLGNINTVTINSIVPLSSRVYSLNYDFGYDANFVLAKGSTSKQVKFDLIGSTNSKALTISSGHTDNRTITFPDNSGTIVLIGGYPATFTHLSLSDTANQVVIGTTNTTTINALPPTASSIISIPYYGVETNLIQAIGTSSKTIKFDLNGSTDNKELMIVSSHTDDRTVTIQDGVATSNLVESFGPSQKIVKFNASSSTDNKVMTITSNHTDDRAVSLSDRTGTTSFPIDTTLDIYLAGPWGIVVPFTISIAGTDDFIILQFPQYYNLALWLDLIKLVTHDGFTAYLPVEYRPSTNIDMPIFVINKYFDTIVPGNIKIGTNGSLSIGLGHDQYFDIVIPDPPAVCGIVGFRIAYT